MKIDNFSANSSSNEQSWINNELNNIEASSEFNWIEVNSKSFQENSFEKEEGWGKPNRYWDKIYQKYN